MAFMEPEIIFDTWYCVETTAGSFILPEDVCIPRKIREYFPEYIGSSAKITGFSTKTGFGARLSAPGYMDSTDWEGVFSTEEEALSSLLDTYSLCAKCYEDENSCPCLEEEEGEN